MQTKNVPLALFALFCIKALLLSATPELVASLAVLGIVSFLYEKFIQDKALVSLRQELSDIKKQDDASKKELEQIKAYISSLKLNGIRGNNGFNKSA